MTHARKQIRDALVTTVTGLATTGATVFAHRAYSHNSLPSLNIMFESEEIDGDDMRTRRLVVIFEARGKATSALDDQLDQIALEVEEAIAADPTVGGVVLSMIPRGFELEIVAESDRPVGLMRIEYTAIYRVDPLNPDVLIN